jgi:hypothetical protein
MTRQDLQPLVLPLLALADLLADTHLKGMIIGGVAAGLLGRPRFTADVDAVILLDPGQIRVVPSGMRRGRLLTEDLGGRGFCQKTQGCSAPSRCQRDPGQYFSRRPAV